MVFPLYLTSSPQTQPIMAGRSSIASKAAPAALASPGMVLRTTRFCAQSTLRLHSRRMRWSRSLKSQPVERAEEA